MSSGGVASDELVRQRLAARRAERMVAAYRSALEETHRALCAAWRAIAVGEPVGTSPQLAARLATLTEVARIDRDEARDLVRACLEEKLDIEDVRPYVDRWKGE